MSQQSVLRLAETRSAVCLDTVCISRPLWKLIWVVSSLGNKAVMFAERFLREHVIFSLLGSGVSESCGKHVSNPVPSSRGIFLTQGSNLCLLQFRQILYHGSHQGSSLNTVGNCQMILQNVCVICVPANDEWAFLLLCTFTILAWLVFNF